MNIRLVAAGGVKEEYFRKACDEYIKRLSRYCSFELYEVDEYRLSSDPSPKEIDNALGKEAENIRRYIKGYTIVLCVEGKQLSSVQLSETLTQAGINGYSTVTFIIGSSYGISREIKSLGDINLSMSSMTFPHQLARVMLLEQIYRAFQIAEGGKYHK